MTVVLVESEKSALALLAWSERLQRTLLPVALGGVWSWRGKIGKAETADGKGTAEVGHFPIWIFAPGIAKSMCYSMQTSIQTGR